MGPPWVGQALFLNNQFRKERAAFFPQRYATNVPNQALLLIWPRRTFLEPCNLTYVECAIQSSKLLYMLLGSWWNLENILSKTKESTVFLCGGETSRAFVSLYSSDVPSAMELQNNVLYIPLPRDTRRACTTQPVEDWDWNLRTTHLNQNSTRPRVPIVAQQVKNST